MSTLSHDKWPQWLWPRHFPANKFSCRNLLGSKRATHGSDLFANQFRTGNLPLVCGGRDEGIGEVLNCQLADTGADSESFHTIGPEELVTNEGSDNSWDSR